MRSLIHAQRLLPSTGRHFRSAVQALPIRFMSDEGHIRDSKGSWSEKERAIENQYFHARDAAKIEKLAKDVEERSKDVNKMQQRIEQMEKELSDLKSQQKGSK